MGDKEDRGFRLFTEIKLNLSFASGWVLNGMQGCVLGCLDDDDALRTRRKVGHDFCEIAETKKVQFFIL